MKNERVGVVSGWPLRLLDETMKKEGPSENTQTPLDLHHPQALKIIQYASETRRNKEQSYHPSALSQQGWANPRFQPRLEKLHPS